MTLDKFRIVSQEEVGKIISSSPSKSCSLDPIPTSILKLCLDELTPVLTLVVNTSLEFADFSPELKRTIVLPLLKKAILDCEILKNFRPVSNLSFLSKLVERIVCVQLVDHLKAHHLYEVFQSAYRQLHSIETALLRVQKWPPLGSRHSWGSNTRSTRSQCCIWYDWLSALTSYTGIIIWYQRQGFGLVPVVSNRSHSNSSDQEINIWAARVEIWCATGVRSGPHSIQHLHHTTGPTHQGAWSDFPSICRRYPALFSIKPSEPSSIVNNISRLEKCVDDIRAWMKLNLLKLNDDKTELLVITSRPSTRQSLHIAIKVGDQDISPSEEPPKNLGVIFYSTCSLKDHVSNVCRSINFNLYSIGKIRRYLDRPTVEKLVNATITSGWITVIA